MNQSRQVRVDPKSEHRSRPLVTVGLPVFNGEDFLEEALEALRVQTYDAFRISVSDNASTDGTWELLERWAARDERITLYRQSENLGAEANYRFLLDAAETPYFMWLAYDDTLAPNYLEKLVAVLEACSHCALACGTTVHVTPGGEIIRQLPFPEISDLSRLARLRTLLTKPDSVRIYGLYRTSALQQAYTIGEEFGYLWAADHLIVLSFVLNDRLCGTPETTLYWRRTGISTDRYRPSTIRTQAHFIWRYLSFHRRLLANSDLRRGDKLRCTPWLLAHANRTIESFVQRPLRRAVRGFIKRGVRRLLLRRQEKGV